MSENLTQDQPDTDPVPVTTDPDEGPDLRTRSSATQRRPRMPGMTRR